MAELRRVGVLTLLCCVLPLAANPAFSSGFEFSHETAYVHFTLPPTLGESVTIDWSVGGDGVEIWGLPGVADFTEVNVSGWAELGPLLSLDAEWNPDGSIGGANHLLIPLGVIVSASGCDGRLCLRTHGILKPSSRNASCRGAW